MTTKKMTSVIALAAMSLGLATAQAQTPTASAPAEKAAAPALSPTEQWIKDVKNPAPWFSWGADLRLRSEFSKNMVTLSAGVPRSQQDYFRFRGRVWTSLAPLDDVSLNARLAAEPREWMQPSFTGANGKHSGMEWRYGIVDNLNIKWKNILDQPLTLTAGRQDIQLGDPLNWWLVGDGTPGDGSFSFFLDSIRLNLDLKDAKTTIDAIYIYQNAQPGAWIPTIGRSSNPAGHPLTATLNDYYLTEQDEQGAILYLSNKSIKNTQVDAYFMYKRDNAQYRWGDDANLYTMGSKITGDITAHWRYSVEGAYQTGNKRVDRLGTPSSPDREVDAWGLNTRLTYQVKDELQNQFRLAGEFMSGDDPSSDKNEGFDQLWGRWPRWSELYIYSYIPETGRVSESGNIIRFGPGWSITPAKNLTFSTDYYALFADRAFSTDSGGLPPSGASKTSGGAFGTGTFRGHFLQTVLKYKFSQHVSGHLWGEFLWMGDYYASANRDMMTYLRAELLFTF